MPLPIALHYLAMSLVITGLGIALDHMVAYSAMAVLDGSQPHPSHNPAPCRTTNPCSIDCLPPHSSLTKASNQNMFQSKHVPMQPAETTHCCPATFCFGPAGT